MMNTERNLKPHTEIRPDFPLQECAVCSFRNKELGARRSKAQFSKLPLKLRFPKDLFAVNSLKTKSERERMFICRSRPAKRPDVTKPFQDQAPGQLFWENCAVQRSSILSLLQRLQWEAGLNQRNACFKNCSQKVTLFGKPSGSWRSVTHHHKRFWCLWALQLCPQYIHMLARDIVRRTIFSRLREIFCKSDCLVSEMMCLSSCCLPQSLQNSNPRES